MINRSTKTGYSYKKSEDLGKGHNKVANMDVASPRTRLRNCMMKSRKDARPFMSSDEENDESLSTHEGLSTKSTKALAASSARSPLSPIQNMVHHMRRRLEVQLGGSTDVESKTSPGLERLRMTPGTDSL